MKRVVIESPYAGDIEVNLAYARAALLDSLNRGEAPIASHLLYTQVLDDADTEQRRQGIEAGFTWNKYADLVAVYVDHGITQGMERGITHARAYGALIEHRYIERGIDEDPVNQA